MQTKVEIDGRWPGIRTCANQMSPMNTPTMIQLRLQMSARMHLPSFSDELALHRSGRSNFLEIFSSDVSAIIFRRTCIA